MTMTTVHADSLVFPDTANHLFARKEHLVIHVSGIVQGVGFRPFVYRLARECHVLGTVRNHSGGVDIHAEGRSDDLRRFEELLLGQAPPASHIAGIVSHRLTPVGFPDFRIIESEQRAGQFTQLPADLALCDDCHRELLDPENRRFWYPFINCTHCGPRFTIIRGLPYDRPDTTMSHFAMCPDCAQEYHDPENRRYHAQPIACPQCGPKLNLLIHQGHTWEPADGAPIHIAIERLRAGDIVLVHGIGGFHLACDAQNSAAVDRLRQKKRREDKPFAVMYRSLKDIVSECDVNSSELEALASVSAPIVLLKRKNTSTVADAVAPRNPLVGALLPYTPLHVLLLNDFRGPLVMTSANLSEEPMIYDPSVALREMGSIADAALVHDRPIHLFADDSIVRCIGGTARVMRRARGYVPQPITVPHPFRFPVLAFGADLKNTFCLGSGRVAILSQHLGDLDSDAAIGAQKNALAHFLHLFADHVRVAVCDQHPDYQTTRLAEEWSAANGVPLIRVQHHHAHLASCLAENGEMGRAVGLCLDGTGYGTDGTVWGGEVLLGDFTSFTRVGCLYPVSMPGGELAARDPWRMALAWLHATYGDEMHDLNLPFMDELRRHIPHRDLRVLTHPELMAHVYPKTSSTGRLFDALSALLGFGTRRQFEGQAAMELESLTDERSCDPYPHEILSSGSIPRFDPRPMFRQVVQDLQRGVGFNEISSRVHETIALGFCELAKRTAEEAELKTVCLSGGCFQNAQLFTRCRQLLSAAGLLVLTHKSVPANDGGMSLGQACIANAQGE